MHIYIKTLNGICLNTKVLICLKTTGEKRLAKVVIENRERDSMHVFVSLTFFLFSLSCV